jgi:DNA-directed RNA polymerase specialized sigma24 family protein
MRPEEKHALRGRSEEFRSFALERSLPLHQSAYLLCGDWHLAHDLVQETLVKVYRHWPRIRQADSPDAYVRRILINEARDRWRHRDKALSAAAGIAMGRPVLNESGIRAGSRGQAQN